MTVRPGDAARDRVARTAGRYKTGPGGNATGALFAPAPRCQAIQVLSNLRARAVNRVAGADPSGWARGEPGDQIGLGKVLGRTRALGPEVSPPAT